MKDGEPKDQLGDVGRQLFLRFTKFFGDYDPNTTLSEQKFFGIDQGDMSSVVIQFVRYRESRGGAMSAYISIQPTRSWPPHREAIVMQEQASTPYGRLPRYSIGPDNKFYESVHLSY